MWLVRSPEMRRQHFTGQQSHAVTPNRKWRAAMVALRTVKFAWPTRWSRIGVSGGAYTNNHPVVLAIDTVTA